MILALVAVTTLLVLRPWESASSRPRQNLRSDHLAVLPLENLSGDPELDYYAAGITEGLIAELGRVGALRVISRRSVMRYLDSDMPLAEIAAELGVDALIEGSVLPVGDRVRVTAQLVQADPEQHLWADTYERDAKDILTLLREVTGTIVSEVQVAVSPREHARQAAAVKSTPKLIELCKLTDRHSRVIETGGAAPARSGGDRPRVRRGLGSSCEPLRMGHSFICRPTWRSSAPPPSKR